MNEDGDFEEDGVLESPAPFKEDQDVNADFDLKVNASS